MMELWPQVILHTGDLRWSDSMAEHPKLKSQTIDVLFLDTTYAKPQHTHPPQVRAMKHWNDCRLAISVCPDKMLVTTMSGTKDQDPLMQDECIALMAKVMKQHAAENPKTLFVVRTNSSYNPNATCSHLSWSLHYRSLVVWTLLTQCSCLRAVRQLPHWEGACLPWSSQAAWLACMV